MRKRAISPFIWFLIFLFLPIGVSIANNTLEPKSEKTIRLLVNWNHQFQFAGHYAALQQGFYRQAGLDVQIQDWKPNLDIVQEVVAGRSDIAVGYSSVLIDYAKGAPIQLLMPVFQFSPMVFLSHTPIETLKDLSGKRVTHSVGMYQLELLKQRAQIEAGAKFNYVQASGDLNDFIENKVDLYAAYSTNEPFTLKEKGIPFSIVDPKSFGIQSYGDFIFTSKKFALSFPKEVKAFNEATKKGWQYALENQEQVVDNIMQNYSVKKSREAMLAEAKATELFVKPAGVKIGDIDLIKLESFLKDAYKLGYISADELANTNLRKLLFNPDSQMFTYEELVYLSNLEALRFDYVATVSPYSFMGQDNQWSGICHDYVAFLADYLGLPLLAHQRDVSHLNAEIQAGLVRHPVACTIADRSLNERLLFTMPIRSMPLAFATDKKMGYVQNMESLEGKKLALVRSHGLEVFFDKRFPRLKYRVFETLNEALNSVKTGSSDGLIGGYAALNHGIQESGLQGMRIVGDLHQAVPLSIGVSREDPLLYSILQKSLLAMTDQQEKQILNRWLKVEVVEQLDNQRLLEFLMPAIAIIMLLMMIVAIFVRQRILQKKYLNNVYELSKASHIEIDSRKFLWVSNEFAKFVGYSPLELMGREYTEFVAHGEQVSVNEIFHRLSEGQEWHGEVSGRKRNGEKFWLQIALVPKLNRGIERTKVLMTCIDITDKKRIEELLIRDELTWLYNRRFYNEVIEQQLSQASRSDRYLGMALIDIDHFKKVNDNYGHQYGDKALITVARTLKSLFNRSGDLVFRMGGEEFLAVVSCESPKEFESFLNRVRLAVENSGMENLQGEKGVVTISIGGYCLSPIELKTKNADVIFKEVDDLLYLAKNNGRNRVEVKKRGIQALPRSNAPETH